MQALCAGSRLQAPGFRLQGLSGGLWSYVAAGLSRWPATGVRGRVVRSRPACTS